MPLNPRPASSRIVLHRPAIFRLTWLGLVSEWFQNGFKQFQSVSSTATQTVQHFEFFHFCGHLRHWLFHEVHGFPGPGCKPSVAATQWALEGGTTTIRKSQSECFDEIRMLAMLAMLLMPSMLSFQRLTFDTFREPVVSLRSTPCCHVSPEELKGSNTTYRDGTRLRS